MTILLILLGLFIGLKVAAFFGKEEQNIDDKNPYLHPELAEQVLPEDMQKYVNSRAEHKQRNIYEFFIKPVIDNVLSFLGMLLLSPVFILIVVAIKIDDPGPVFFMQNRLTRNKCFFPLA